MRFRVSRQTKSCQPVPVADGNCRAAKRLDVNHEDQSRCPQPDGRRDAYAQSKPLAIEEVELDDPRHGEVLVKIGAAGLCHSDLSVIDGNRPRPTPMVLGHEAAGVVESSAPASTTSRSAITS